MALYDVQISENRQSGVAAIDGANLILQRVLSEKNHYSGVTLEGEGTTLFAKEVQVFNNGQMGVWVRKGAEVRQFEEVKARANQQAQYWIHDSKK